MSSARMLEEVIEPELCGIQGVQLLDAVKERLGFRSDNAIALALKINRVMIYMIRTRQRPFSASNRIKVLDLIGFYPISLEQSLKSNRLIEMVHAWRQARSRSAPPAEGNPETVLLDVCRSAFSIKSDSGLARFFRRYPERDFDGQDRESETGDPASAQGALPGQQRR